VGSLPDCPSLARNLSTESTKTLRRLAYEASNNGLLSPDLAARHPPGERRKTPRRETRQLAHNSSGQEILGCSKLALNKGQAGLRYTGTSPWLRPAQIRAGQVSASHMCNCEMTTGPSLISSGRAVTFEQYPFQSGSKLPSICGSRLLASRKGACFGASAALVLSGVHASVRNWCGGWFGRTQSWPASTSFHHTISGALAPGFVTRLAALEQIQFLLAPLS
jgi:hypothetical protein